MFSRSNKKEESPDKIFYSMGELAEMFDVNVSLIRYWDKEFDILKPKRNGNGNRMFTPEDVDNLHLIYYLVKECGMTLEGAKKRLDNKWDETQKKFEIIKRLKKIRSKLNLLQHSIQTIENNASNIS